MVGRVHGPAVGVLDLALPRELVEQQPLPPLDLTDPLVDAVLGQQPVDLHGAHLPDPVDTGDRLIFGSRRW
jgi:hypothetical protein